MPMHRVTRERNLGRATAQRNAADLQNPEYKLWASQCVPADSGARASVMYLKWDC